MISNYVQGLGNLSEISYQNMLGYKRASMLFAHTNEELIEYCKCKMDPIYFMEKYCFISTCNGKKLISLRPYQKQIINDYFTYKFNITASSRQVGMSTIESLIILHEGLFNIERSYLTVSHKMMNSVEKMNKIRDIYSNIPYFLKPGVISYSKTSLILDNGCRIIAKSGPNIAIGFNIHGLFMDDFAHIYPKVLERIYSSLVPMMVSQVNSRIFISSSPNGYNHFAKLFMNAERKEGDPNKNMYHANRVYWWEVPNRDETWKQKEILNIGPDLFDQEYDLQFFRYKK